MADQKESSVLFSLKELMDLEQERIAREEADRARKAEELRLKREAEERAKRELEEQRAREEEERRRAEAQRQREEEARLEAIKQAEIERAKRYLAGLYPLGLETNEQVAAAIAETILFDLGEDWVPRYRERVMAVTPMQAAEAAARFFFADPFALVLVGDRDAIRRGIEDAGIDAEIEDLPLDEAA